MSSAKRRNFKPSLDDSQQLNKWRNVILSINSRECGTTHQINVKAKSEIDLISNIRRLIMSRYEELKRDEYQMAYDPIDVSNIVSSDHLIERFVNDMSNKSQSMVKCAMKVFNSMDQTLRWRMTIKINELSLEDLDTDLLSTGFLGWSRVVPSNTGQNSADLKQLIYLNGFSVDWADVDTVRRVYEVLAFVLEQCWRQSVDKYSVHVIINAENHVGSRRTSITVGQQWSNLFKYFPGKSQLSILSMRSYEDL